MGTEIIYFGQENLAIMLQALKLFRIPIFSGTVWQVISHYPTESKQKLETELQTSNRPFRFVLTSLIKGKTMNQRIATGFVRSGHRILAKRDWNKRLKANWMSTDSKYQFTQGCENESQVVFTPAVLESTVSPGPSSTIPSWKVVLDGVYAVAFFGFSFAMCAWLIFQMQFSLGNFWP